MSHPDSDPNHMFNSLYFKLSETIDDHISIVQKRAESSENYIKTLDHSGCEDLRINYKFHENQLSVVFDSYFLSISKVNK